MPWDQSLVPICRHTCRQASLSIKRNKKSQLFLILIFIKRSLKELIRIKSAGCRQKKTWITVQCMQQKTVISVRCPQLKMWHTVRYSKQENNITMLWAQFYKNRMEKLKSSWFLLKRNKNRMGKATMIFNSRYYSPVMLIGMITMLDTT